MIRTTIRTAHLAAAVMPLTACGQKAPPTSPAPDPPGLAPLAPDPEQEAKKAKEAAYREHLEAGTKALAAGEFDAAVGHLKRALAENPGGAEAHLHLGRAHVGRKDDAAAVKAYTDAVRSGDNYVEAYMERATALERLGRADEAEADYRRVIAIDTDRKLTARAYWQRSEIADRRGDRAQYREFREEAMKLDVAYAARVTGGDVLLRNRSEGTVVVRLDQIVSPEGKAYTPPEKTEFKLHGDNSAYLSLGEQLLTARSVRYTVITGAGTKPGTATYKSGMTLEIAIYNDDVPK
jgi:tetratricopeptide (TPR) repeat protein